ncbi:MAG: zinc-dependent peptidase [Proteobacteria bacterium]|nr:zinc-dependent peptidase [Pseudomonadota bacterium]
MGWFGNLQQRRRKQSELDESLWRRAIAPYAFITALNPPDLLRLREMVIAFLDQKQLHGAAGLVLSNEARVAIAVQACLPVLNLGLECYEGWVGVIVYPGEFRVAREIVDEAGVVHEFDDELSGEAWPDGPVILSWQDASLSEPGYNVVIHEFAHKIHMLRGNDDGFPAPHAGMDRERWELAFESAFARFCGAVGRGAHTRMDPYAAEHPAEFFAVASEAFFTDAPGLVAEFPAIYRELAAFYRQDPLARTPT